MWVEGGPGPPDRAERRLLRRLRRARSPELPRQPEGHALLASRHLSRQLRTPGAKLLEDALHQDLRPGDVFTCYTTTGWRMWNYLVGGLLAGTTIVLYDGCAT